MRDWVASLEGVIDGKLNKWHKIPKMENGEAVQIGWKWNQTLLSINIFWEQNKETVVLSYTSPRIDHDYRWHGLTDTTLSKITDRVGNLAQVTMHPPIDPMDPPHEPSD